MVQDITIYAQKCKQSCATNNCPVAPYFVHPDLLRCVAICPAGYIGNGDNCDPVQFCHSTCGDCNSKNNANDCTTCSSTLTELRYAASTVTGACSFVANNNAQLLETIQSTTDLSSSYLKNITYNTNQLKSSGLLSTLYTGQVIDFKDLTSNTIVFEFDSIPTHKKLLVRARVRGECTTNNTVSMILSGTSPVTVTTPLSSGQESIV